MNDATQPRDAARAQSHRVRTRARISPLINSLVIIVGLPTLVASIYFGLVASDVYVSETRYAIRTSDQTPAVGILATMLGPSASTPGNDAEIVRDYILSRDMLDQLDGLVELRRHYQSRSVDWISRLKEDAAEERFVKYYRKMVEVKIETGSEITALKVRAFSAETAKLLAKTIVVLSERLVNEMSARITEDTLRFARAELDRAEAKVRETNAAVTKFRNETRSIDPGEETSAVLSIVTNLESQLAAARAELQEAESIMQPNSSRVRTLRNRVAAIQGQVILERERLASDSGPDLTRLIDSYEPLVLDQKLAEKRYTSALASLELSRAEAQRKQRYLITFVPPELPDEALEPERLLSIFTILFASLLVYGIGGLIVAAIKDHMDL